MVTRAERGFPGMPRFRATVHGFPQVLAERAWALGLSTP
jgi:hypothetical protein